MTVEVWRTVPEAERLATVEDGELTEATDGVRGTLEDADIESEDDILQMFDGPRVVAIKPEAQAADLAEGDWWDDHLEQLHERTWHSDEKTLLGFSEGQTPQFVKDQLMSAVLEGGEIFSDIKSIPDSELMAFRTYMARELSSDGWTITDMRDEIQDRFGVEKKNAETMARSTTQSMVNEAREEGYRAREDFEDLRFTWSGMDYNPDRSSEVCKAIKEAIPPEGLPLDELKELVQSKSKEFGHTPKGWTVHPNCTHQHTRVV